MAGVESTAEADLQLLQSNLAKSKRISGRASALLGGFDDRLARLERSVSRIHAETTGLTRSTANIDALLEAVDLLLSSNDLVEREEAAIAKGPRMNNLDGYKRSITKLTEASAGLQGGGPTGLNLGGNNNIPGLAAAKTQKDQDEMLVRIHAAIDSGQKQLGQIVINALRDNAAPANTLSPSAIQKMSNLISFICGLPQSSNGASAYEKELQKIYAESRASAVTNSLQALASEAIDASKNGGLGGGATLGSLMSELLAQTADELGLIPTVGFQAYTTAYIYRLFLASASSPLHLFVDAGAQITSIVKKNLSKNVKVAFRALDQLNNLAPDFDEWIRQKGGRAENELGEVAQALRAACVRSIPEIFEDIKAWGNKVPTPSESSSGQIAEMSKNVLGFMQQLVDVPNTTESCLQSLGDGGWDFAASASLRGTPRMSDSVDGLLPKYLGDLLGALLTALETRSKNMRSLPQSNMAGPVATTSNTNRPSVGPIFLLNNIAFLRREVLSSAISDVLGDRSEDSLNRLHRSAKTSYMEIFSGLVACLMDAPSESGLLKTGLGVVGVGPSGEKREVKDRFVRFNDALSDVENVHRMARIDPNEEVLRDRLKDDVYKMVIPTYKAFASKNVGTTHHQLDVSTVESRLSKLFR